MLKNLSLALILTCPSIAFAQLSKGDGDMVTLPGKNIRCYRPQHFKIQSEPPGVIHKESGTFVILVKVPQEKRVSLIEGLPRSYFEDPRYEILSLDEGKESALHRHDGRRLYTMRYMLNGFEFERHTILLNSGNEQYLIIGNISVKFRPQVMEEVEKVMANFVIR
jgi:hypothetical protein